MIPARQIGAGMSDDVALLEKALSHALEEDTHAAFVEMYETLVTGARRALSTRQRAWVEGVLEAHEPTYENLVSAGKVPRGREVELMVRDKPLRPPGRA